MVRTLKWSCVGLGIASRLGRALSKSVPIVLVGLVALVTVGLSWHFWEPLQAQSEAVRNLGLVAGGLIAVILGVWRSVIAHRRAEAAESDSLDRMFQIASEMLGHGDVAVRIAGVVTLCNLAKQHPERYRQIVHDVLFHFSVEKSHDHSESERPPVNIGDLTFHGPQDGALAFLGYHELRELSAGSQT